MNDHGDLECLLHIQVKLSIYEYYPEYYSFFLITQKNIELPAVGETGIWCGLNSDLAHTYVGSCYTLTVTTTYDSSGNGTLTASQGTQLYSYVSKESNIIGTQLIVRIAAGDWDFWNSTLSG